MGHGNNSRLGLGLGLGRGWDFGLGSVVVALFVLSGCASTQEARGRDVSQENGAISEPAEGAAHTATEAERAYLAIKAPIEAERVTLAVNGLSCPLCATNVDKQLAGVRGVSDIRIDFARGEIDLLLAEPRPSPATLARAIDQAGFTLVKITTR